MLREPGSRLHSGRKKNIFVTSRSAVERVGGGEGKCASATFSFPNQLLGSLCLPNVFCHFTLFFAFSPTSELGPMLLKKFIHLTNDSLR